MAPLSPVAGNESQYDLSRHSDEVHDAPALSGGGGEQPGKQGLPPAVDIRSPDIGTSWLDPLQRTSSLSD